VENQTLASEIFSPQAARSSAISFLAEEHKSMREWGHEGFDGQLLATRAHGLHGQCSQVALDAK